MAHYDCSDCGAGMGIGYGYCDNCTPKDVFDKKKAYEKARMTASSTFDKEVSKLKEEFVSQQSEKERQEYDEAYNLHKPKRRW